MAALRQSIGALLRLARGGRVAGWLLLAAILPAVGAAPAPTSSEYQLKAVFLFNFAQFVEWPGNAFAKDATPLVIGVAGIDPFGSYLDELVRGEKVGGHALQIRRFAPGQAIGDCQILFICGSEESHLPAILGQLKGRHVLTVSDLDQFARLGGMVRFEVGEGRIKLRVNLAAAREAGLVISSKILRVSTIVTSGTP